MVLNECEILIISAQVEQTYSGTQAKKTELNTHNASAKLSKLFSECSGGVK